jgi:hypothetical protein
MAVSYNFIQVKIQLLMILKFGGVSPAITVANRVSRQSSSEQP